LAGGVEEVRAFSTLILLLLPAAHAADWTAYIGTYTRQDSKGIYAYRFNPSSGKLTSLGLAAESSNPSFLTVHPNQHFVYAANENPEGTVSAFAIEAASGHLKFLNSVSSKGSGPCHVAVDQTGKFLFAANYNSGSVAVFPIREDGSLGEASAFVQHSGSSANPQRQEGPHAHSVNVAPDNRFVLVADLGLDQVIAYSRQLKPAAITKLTPGSGPRHLVFRADGKFVYVLSEISATVTVFRYDSKEGTLAELQTVSTLPPGFPGPKSGAEIAIHPGGKFLYASNRGHNSIAVFRIDSSQGTLTAAGNVSTQGKTPRNFAIDPTGAFLLAANQDSGNIVEFRIDRKTGALTPTGTTMQVPVPVSIVFASAGR
jgi:6-phosphogluconolactonase